MFYNKQSLSVYAIIFTTLLRNEFLESNNNKKKKKFVFSTVGLNDL